MKTSELSRVEFLRWLAELDGGKPEVSDLPTAARRGGEITLIWFDASASALPLIGVRAADLREFLAFTSTYVGTYVPFTAFFRVIPLEMVDFLPRFDGGGSRDGAAEAALIGVAIAEAALQTGIPTARVVDLNVQSCLTTSGVVAARSMELGYSNSMAALAVERWHSVRATLSATQPWAEADRTGMFWSTVLAKLAPEPSSEFDRNSKVSLFLDDAMRSGSRGHDIAVDALSPFISDTNELVVMLRASRENRVRALEQIAAKISSSATSLIEAEMILGFAAAQVAEGSFAYLPLILRYEKKYPLSCLWFGMFCGLRQGSDVLTAGDCLGRRVLRHIRKIAGLLPDIDADINYEEFLLLSNDFKRRKIRTDIQSMVSVELLPGVDAAFRLPRQAGGSAGPSRAAHQNDEQLERARRLVVELANVLRTSQRVAEDQSPYLFPEIEEAKTPIVAKPPSARKKAR
jgi:hypothetical protein